MAADQLSGILDPGGNLAKAANDTVGVIADGFGGTAQTVGSGFRTRPHRRNLLAKRFAGFLELAEDRLGHRVEFANLLFDRLMHRARPFRQPRGDLVELFGLAMQPVMEILRLRDGALGDAGEFLCLSPQGIGDLLHPGLGPFGGIGQPGEIAAEGRRCLGQDTAPSEIRHCQPEKGKRRKDSGQYRTDFMRQQYGDRRPANGALDIDGANHEPDGARKHSHRRRNAVPLDKSASENH